MTKTWSIREAEFEFPVHRDTLKKRLENEGAKPDDAGRYTTRQICRAVFGDVEAEKLRKLRAEADLAEMQRDLTSRQQIPVADAIEITSVFCQAVRQRVLNSSLTDEEKNAVLRDLNGMKDADFMTLPTWED